MHQKRENLTKTEMQVRCEPQVNRKRVTLRNLKTKKHETNQQKTYVKKKNRKKYIPMKFILWRYAINTSFALLPFFGM